MKLFDKLKEMLNDKIERTKEEMAIEREANERIRLAALKARLEERERQAIKTAIAKEKQFGKDERDPKKSQDNPFSRLANAMIEGENKGRK